MSGGIYVLKDNETLEALAEQQYEPERLLQLLLARYPSILAGDQISPSVPRRWLLVRREVEVPDESGGSGRWSLDHLFLDQDGIPTLVEVKRSTDTRIRREVVGQMLDYAANAMAYWSIETVQENFRHTCADQEQSPDKLLDELLGPEGDAERFWTAVKTNLQAGRLRLLFVADRIPDELRRVVEFLNSQMDPAEVLAIEIKQFVGESVKTLVPRVIGQTAEAARRKGATRSTREWDEESFFAELEKRPRKEEAPIARKLLAWSESRGMHVQYGRGKTNASFTPILVHNGEPHRPFTVYTGYKPGRAYVEMNFSGYSSKRAFEDEAKRRDMLGRLNGIRGVSLSEDAIDRFPSIRLMTLARGEAIKQFLSVMDWYLDGVQST